MPIWISNSRTVLAYERTFFALLCDNLSHRRGSRRLTERFHCLAGLAALPWLDQPRILEPTQLIFEVHEAWDELWMTRVRDLVVGPATREAVRRIQRGVPKHDSADPECLGRYLAAPLHELTAFAASTKVGRRVRASTHRELLDGPRTVHGWRLIQGGRSLEASATSAPPQ